MGIPNTPQPVVSQAVGEPVTTLSRVSPIRALLYAVRDARNLLAFPFDLRNWLKLSAITLVLGGGTPSAAFNWSLGSLPGDIGLQEVKGRIRDYITQHVWFAVTTIILTLVALFLLFYLRASFRFLLIDSVARHQAQFRRVWGASRPLRHSYFLWLLLALGGIGAVLSAASIVALPYFHAAASAGLRSPAFWTLLIAILVIDVLVGLILAVAVTITDDLVAPIMMAEGLPLAASWRRMWASLRAEPGSLVLYILLRFALSLGIGIVVLFLLFSVLLVLFSSAIITGALVVLTLHVWGIHWVWNPLTASLAGIAVFLLMSMVLILLSVVSMPGQVLLQAYGMRFMEPRVSSVQSLMHAFERPEAPSFTN